MKALIIYHSRTGNTKIVAHALAAVLNAKLLHADSVEEEDLHGWDYVGLGSGVYWLRHDKKIFAVASRLPRNTKVFTFSTSGLKNWFAVTFYRLTMRFRLERKGLQVVGQWHCPGHDLHPLVKPFNLNKGRPHADDIQSVEAFARKLCV
ncbi:MAG TPA: flavodoxin family protein [Polyangiaceae bacterium]|nr:flavodoxin family protein [Polyangiaceae bacterium]